MRFSWSNFNRVVRYINFLDKFVSFRILDSLIAFTSKFLLVALNKYSRSLKFLFKEQEFMRNKESEFSSIFIFWISSILRFLQLMKFSAFFLLDSAVNSLIWLNNSLKLGGELVLTYYCHLYISPQKIHSFQSCYGWTDKNFDCWGFQKEMF